MKLNWKFLAIATLGFFSFYGLTVTSSEAKDAGLGKAKPKVAKQEEKKEAVAKKEKAPKAVKLTISTKGDELVFDKATLTAKPGAMIELTFKNAAKANSGLSHNFVLTYVGKDAEVANAGISAGPDKGWTPDSPDVIAHTKLVDPQKSETITFKAPDKAGDYPYICTFPGHASTMKGVLKLK